MTEISNKKKKFIKRNFRQLSIEELADKTGLKPNVIKPLINEYSAEIPGENQRDPIKNGADTRLSWKTILLTSLLFAAVALVIYYPSLQGDFVFDDGVIQDKPLIHITRLSQLTDLLFSKEHDRRIGLSSFALNYYFGGLNTFGYHLVNVIIHILNGLTLFLLSHTILTLSLDEKKGRGNTFKIAFLGSFIWLVHPIQTQAVSYIVQRLTSLSSLFFLLSLLFYMKGRVIHSSKRVVLFLLSLLFGLLALGTKQNTATLPFFILLSEFLFFQPHPFKMEREKWRLIILFGGLFFLISWIYLGSDFISRMALNYEKRGWTPLERMMTEWRVIIFYMGLMIYPHPSRLNLDHDFSVSHALFSPPTTILSLLFIIGSLCLAIFLMKRNRFVSYAILWFFGNLVIESSIIPLELVFEHRLYLPSMGLIILALGLCFNMPKREWEKWITASIIPLILLFSYWTYERASIWGEPLSIWMDAAKKSPNKARPYNNLGYAYFKNGMLEEAIPELKKALAINPNLEKAHANLGGIYCKKGLLDEAISECKKSIAINPNYAEAHANLGAAYLKKGMVDEAIAEYKQVLFNKPHDAKAHSNLGSAYIKKGMVGEAIAEYKKAIDIKPDYAKAYTNLATAYYKKGMVDEAISQFEKALAINPNYAKAHSKLGGAYYEKGLLDEAISEYKKSIAINPNDLETRCRLGLAYGKKSMLDEAVSEFKIALAIDPNFAEAHNKLGSLLEAQGRLSDAISAYREAIRLKPDYHQAYNSMAWIYATSSDALIRNGDEAVVLATKACELTGFKKAEVLDTLAAAYAEQGNFNKAVEYQSKAIELAPPQIKKEFQKRLQLYKLGRPYREQYD